MDGNEHTAEGSSRRADVRAHLGMASERPVGKDSQKQSPSSPALNVGWDFIYQVEKELKGTVRYIKEHERFPYDPFLGKVLLSMLRLGGGRSEEELEW